MDPSTISQPSGFAPAPARSRPFLPTRAHLLALWPALAATALFLALIGRQIVAIKALEGGRFAYPLDDTYAHLAIAKNLVQHGAWTFNALNGFETASSSLIWPVLLAVCFSIFGVHEYFPLILNILAVVGLLFYAGEALRRAAVSSVPSLLTLCVIVVFTPMAVVVSVGMEHCLHAFLSIVFVDMAARLLMDGSESVTTARTPWWFCAVGVLLVLTRYEGMFLIAAAGLLLLCRKRWKLAVTLGVLSVAPVVIFGLYSLSNGWFFLPNSLMLRGNVHLVMTVPGLILYFSKWYNLMMSEPHMPAVIAAAAVALVGSLQRRWNLWTYPSLALTLILMTVAQHLQFASVGWFYRYEAYLLVLIFFGVGTALGQNGPATGFRYWLRPAAIPHLAALALAALLFGAPLWPRAHLSYRHMVTASYSVYRQQYQMARFLRQFYQGKGVIANDIGAISYMADIRLLDYYGLANVKVLRLRRQGKFDQEAVRRLSQEHQTEIAIVYDEWASELFGGPLPEWVKLGWWTIPNNTVCAYDTVVFYATSQEQAPKLLRALQQFAPALPKDVVQEGAYRGADSLNAVGVYYPPGGPKDALHFWTQQSAQFNIYPAEGQTLGSGDTTLNLAISTINQNQTIEVFFNDELVLTKAIPPAESEHWISFPVKVQWRPGANIVRLVGHGKTALRPGDPRPALFAVLDPRRMIAPTGVIAQPGVAQPKE